MHLPLNKTLQLSRKALSLAYSGHLNNNKFKKTLIVHSFFLSLSVYLPAGALPIVHITLLCQPLARRAAMFGYVLFSCRGVHDALTAQSGARRLRSFAFQALFRAFLFFLRWFRFGTGNPESLHLYVIMDALALMGGLVNVWRVPERFSPGTFDYWFNSHQIMHVIVVLAIMFLHWGTMEDLAWLKDYQCAAK